MEEQRAECIDIRQLMAGGYEIRRIVRREGRGYSETHLATTCGGNLGVALAYAVVTMALDRFLLTGADVTYSFQHETADAVHTMKGLIQA